MLVTAKVGPIFTVTRAYDGTAAKAHSAGATVIHAGIGPTSERVIASTYATGTLMLAAQPTPGDTITLGDLTFTYVDTIPLAGEIPIGADVTETQTNTVSLVNQGIGATYAKAGLIDFVADVSTVYAAAPGTAGNGVATTSVFTDGANFFGQASLSGGADGTDSGHIAAQSMALTGSSAAAPMLHIAAAPGTDEFAQPNIFEIVTADGRDLINIDSGGNLYTLRDLRMADPDRAIIFRVGQDKVVFIRVADKDAPFQVLVESSPPITAFVIRPTATVSSRFTAIGAGSVALEVDSFGQAGDDTDLIRALGTENFDLVFRVMQGGAVVTAQHTAPDDDNLNTGDMALWFDQTPGAAKFMIKAKDSDGTVVSGAWPLI
jgi:hypothetical protein